MKNIRDKIIKECNNLEKVMTILKETLTLIENLENDIYFESLIGGLTLYLENFYMGVERILSLIAKEVDKIIPSGGSWHLQLLQQMTLEIPSIRPAVISDETYEQLNEFRGFRHIARSLYAYDLDSKRVIELGSKATECHNLFRKDIDKFILFFF